MARRSDGQMVRQIARYNKTPAKTREVKAVVAAGKSLLALDGEKLTGYLAGVPVYAPKQRHFVEGEEVELPLDEARRLRGLGVEEK